MNGCKGRKGDPGGTHHKASTTCNMQRHAAGSGLDRVGGGIDGEGGAWAEQERLCVHPVVLICRSLVLCRLVGARWKG